MRHSVDYLLATADASRAPSVLVIVLWTGLAILTVALMVLMRTRWGQAKPLSKCAVLSLFAHVLFFAYAYGTRLIFSSPDQPSESMIRLSIHSGGDTGFESGLPPLDAAQQSEPAAAAPDLLMPPELAADALPNELPAEEVAHVPAPDLIESPREVSDELLASLPAQTPEELPDPTPTEALPEAPTTSQLVDVSPPELEPSPPDAIASTVTAQPDDSQSLTSSTTALTEVPQATSQSAADPLAASTETSESVESSGAQPKTLVSAARPKTAAPRRDGDNQPLPHIYRLRVADDRQHWLELNGGNPDTERAVQAALRWLASVQEADGRWDADRFGAGQETKVLGHDRRGAGKNADTGISGLALLAFLGAGNTHFDGQYRENVQHGLEFILSQQANDGNLAGQATLFARMYCHGIATLAVSEAYAMTGDQRVRPFLERAVRYTVQSQHPGTGGWRYQPADTGDMSQFGWQVMALKSAEAAGITIPRETHEGMLRFLSSCTRGEHRGLASYRPGEALSRTMTAEALVCRYFLEEVHDPATVREATDYVLTEVPGGEPANFYYWYYGSLALFQSQGEAWPQWNRALQQQLLVSQQHDGNLAGSWNPDTIWGTYGGRVYSTAMAALSLEVFYRYLPIYSQ